MLFTNERVCSGAQGPGECHEIRFQPSLGATVTIIGAGSSPSGEALMTQQFCVELADPEQPVPLARKDSLRGVALASITTTFGDERECVARIRNTGAHAQDLSLLLAIG